MDLIIFVIFTKKNARTLIFPIGDEQVDGPYKPVFSYSFIGLNIILFLYQLSFEDNLICQWGSIPEEIVRGQDSYTLLTSMFMHGGWLHLIGNMTFLWVFADNIESTIGNIPFVIFYVLGGLAASALHIYFSMQAPELAGCYSPCQSTVPYQEGMALCTGAAPVVGASGSIAAVLGAYLIMFPKSKIKIFVLYFFRNFRLSAFIFLGIWIVQQLVSGFMSLNQTTQVSGVAWWAHVGGFAFGVVAGIYFRGFSKPKKQNTEFESDIV